MTAPLNRMHELAQGVNAWSRLRDYSFPQLDQGLIDRCGQGKPSAEDYAAIKAAHTEAQRQIPFFWPSEFADPVTPTYFGYSQSVGALRYAMADTLGIKEPMFPGLAAALAGIRRALSGA